MVALIVLASVAGYVLVAMVVSAAIDVAQDRRFTSFSTSDRVSGCNSYNCHSLRTNFSISNIGQATRPCNNKNHFSWCSTALRVTVACLWPLIIPVALLIAGVAFVIAGVAFAIYCITFGVRLFSAKVFIPSYQHLYRGIQWTYNEVVDPKNNVRKKEIEA